MSEQTRPVGLDYRAAGVDIEAGDALVERIKPFAKRTMRPEVLGGIGGFGALFEVSKKYKNPVMVSGTDGVGTKLKLAFRMKKHDTIGIDLVAMSVNDILVSGAEPAFFLDYFACGKLDVDVAADVVKGIANGCEQAGCALIGGETAEMPGMYDPNEYDLAGFAVGLVDKDHIIDGTRIVPGDVVIGLASSGAAFERLHADPQGDRGQQRRPLRDLRRQAHARRGAARAHAHLREARARHARQGRDQGHRPHHRRRPHGKRPARAARAARPRAARQLELAVPAIFEWLQKQGNIEDAEMHRTFNCGIGMVLVVAARGGEAAIERCSRRRRELFEIGTIVARPTRRIAPRAVVV